MCPRTVSEENRPPVLKFSQENMIRITEGVIGQANESEHKSKQGARESGRQCVREWEREKTDTERERERST